MKIICFLFVALYCLANARGLDVARPAKQFTLRGRVLFPGGSRTPIEPNGVLTVELQDTSLMDAPAQVVGRSVGQAIRFPMAFAVKYSSDQIIAGHTYTLSVSIRNPQNELLYINDVQIAVTPTGAQRTKLINAPVILVKKPAVTFENRRWPELMGKNGDEAVRIIKQQTGFTDVMVVRQGSPITMDLRTNRVRVLVNDRGLVSMIPFIA